MNASHGPSARAGSFALLLGLSALFGCDSKNADALPEWSPADHDNQKTPVAGQVDTTQRPAGMPNLEKFGITDVVLATWKQNCVRCHGTIGRGDGPDGRVLRPPDLTNPSWQRVAIDSEIRHTIKRGRGRMPAFGHLPDETVDGLIRLIRMLAPKAQSDEAQAQPSAEETQPAAQGSTEASPESEEGAPPPQRPNTSSGNQPPGHP